MRLLLVGVGAAGNKAVTDAINSGITPVEDTILINSTSKDFPSDYKGAKIILSDNDTGCGKERSVAKEYTKHAIAEGKFNIEGIDEYATIIVITSVEGGTGSGAVPTIALMFDKVYKKNVHIIAFTGFEEDVRGLANTVEFFKEIAPSIIVQSISNAAYVTAARGNKIKAEKLANKDMIKRISIISGEEFIPGEQNIDDTDLMKLVSTAGYMTVEKKVLDKSLETKEDFDQVIKNMIYNSASIDIENPSAARIGVILNLSPASEDGIDYKYDSLKTKYTDNDKSVFEVFTQKQWDEDQEYIAFIISGMKMPLDEVKAVYDKYLEATAKVNKEKDEFYSATNDLKTLEEDNMFNMIKDKDESSVSFSEFLSIIQED